MAKWFSQGWEERLELEPLHLGAQGYHHQLERASNGVGSKGDLKPRMAFGGFGGLTYKLK